MREKKRIEIRDPDLAPLVAAEFQKHVVPEHVGVRGSHLPDAAHRPVHEVVKISNCKEWKVLGFSSVTSELCSIVLSTRSP